MALIARHNGSTIPARELARLLGVKATTLNARFRRTQISVSVVGRTNYVPLEIALNLAAHQKYALMGLPTLQKTSRREEAQIPKGFSIDQSLLTSAATILKHALKCQMLRGDPKSGLEEIKVGRKRRSSGSAKELSRSNIGLASPTLKRWAIVAMSLRDNTIGLSP